MIKFVDRKNENYYTDYEIANSRSGYLKYAPYYIMDNILTDKQVDDLAKMLDKDYGQHLMKGSIIGADDPSTIDNIRNSNVAFIEQNEAYKVYDDVVISATTEINKNIFNMDLTSYMNPQYTTYGPTQHFDWHPDGPFAVMDMRGLNCIPNHLRWRKLSLSVMLSDESEFIGGDFNIAATSANPEGSLHTVKLAKGSGIFFPAFAAHRVTPIVKGTRKTLVYWFCGPRWR